MGLGDTAAKLSTHPRVEYGISFVRTFVGLGLCVVLVWAACTRTSQNYDLTRFSEDKSHTKFLPLALPSILPPSAIPDFGPESRIIVP